MVLRSLFCLSVVLYFREFSSFCLEQLSGAALVCDAFLAGGFIKAHNGLEDLLQGRLGHRVVHGADLLLLVLHQSEDGARRGLLVFLLVSKVVHHLNAALRLGGNGLRDGFDGHADLDPVVETLKLLNAGELLCKGLDALELADLNVHLLDEVSLSLLVLNIVDVHGLQAVLKLL